MEYTNEQMRTTRIRMTPFDGHAPAPRSLTGAMLGLSSGGGDDVLAALVERQEDDTATTWRALWLTENVIISGEASKAVLDWDGDDDDQAQDHCFAWVRSLANVTSLTVNETVAIREFSHGPWRWDIGTATITFRDGETASVPLFGERLTSPNARLELDKIVGLVCARFHQV